MKTLRIYLENSIIGGYFDNEFKEYTIKLFDEFKAGEYKAVIFSHVTTELDDGVPDYIKKNL
jgi:hypothetical protein